MFIKKVVKYGVSSFALAAGALLYFLKFPPLYAAALVILSMFIFIFVRTKPMKKHFTMHEFIITFTHFRVALDSDANVFHALVTSIERAAPSLAEELQLLHSEMMSDHSVTPYINFAKNFKEPIITHIMINIYLLINHGVDAKRLWQFNYIFEALIKANYDEVLEDHKSSYEKFDTVLYFGTAVLMMTILLNVMTLIGAVIGG